MAEAREELIWHNICPECGGGLRFITTINPGNDTGYGCESLCQCVVCKNIESRRNPVPVQKGQS